MPDNSAQTPPVSTLHGRRKGKKLRTLQFGLMRDMLPEITVNIAEPILNPSALFPHEPQQLWMEIGFGGGEHLSVDAVTHPEVGFFGCEPFENGVAKLLAQIESHQLANIRLHVNDAGLLLEALPDACLSRINIRYPDPWPKRRQRKRRFINDPMLQRLARVMKPGAMLRFATDIDDYAGWVLQRILRSSDFDWKPNASSDWLEPWANWPSTRYEDKALKAGRRPAYFTFLRN